MVSFGHGDMDIKVYVFVLLSTTFTIVRGISVHSCGLITVSSGVQLLTVSNVALGLLAQENTAIIPREKRRRTRWNRADAVYRDESGRYRTPLPSVDMGNISSVSNKKDQRAATRRRRAARKDNIRLFQDQTKATLNPAVTLDRFQPPRTPERGTHTLQYLYTAPTPGTHFPQFTPVGLVDGEQVVYYDSNTKKMIPKTEWMEKIKVNDTSYWDSETRHMEDQQDWFQVFVYRSKQRFNHNAGDHTVQRMYGCELDDDGTTRGYDQYAYDGEDFISLDLTTGTWTAANDQANSFINDWDPSGEKAKYWKDFLETDCIAQLQKFVSYGRKTLQRKVPPEVSVFQKHSPSPEVVCHATGFFPKAVMITWQKDGEDVHEDVVEIRETLPNQDGSFQKRGILKVPAEELQKHKYTCVVQHSSLEKELVREVPKGGGSDGVQIGVIVGVVAALVALVVAGIVAWRKKKNSGEGRKEANGSLNHCYSQLIPAPQTSTNSPEGDSRSNNCNIDAWCLPAERRPRDEEIEMMKISSELHVQ